MYLERKMLNTKIKISIITVAYNSGQTIENTMDSLLQQSYAEWEYIVVDGGSADDTVDKVRSKKAAFGGRLRWISENDKGIYDAMNKGIQMATGDVVGFLNSDDYYTDSHVLQTIAEAFSLHSDIDAVYGDIHFVRADNPARCARYYSSRRFSPFWLRFGFMPAHPSFYCRRDVYLKAGLYNTDYQIGADYEMMVRLFMRHQIKGLYIAKDFVTMRMGGISNKHIRSRLTLIKEDIRACRENGIYTNPIFICFKFLYKIFEYRC